MTAGMGGSDLEKRVRALEQASIAERRAWRITAVVVWIIIGLGSLIAWLWSR